MMVMMMTSDYPEWDGMGGLGECCAVTARGGFFPLYGARSNRISLEAALLLVVTTFRLVNETGGAREV